MKKKHRLEGHGRELETLSHKPPWTQKEKRTKLARNQAKPNNLNQHSVINHPKRPPQV